MCMGERGGREVGSSSLRVYLDTFILTYWTLLAFGWTRRVNRVKVTRGCAMAWRPTLRCAGPGRAGALCASVRPMVCLSACLPVRLLVCSCRFVCLTAHCAHTACGIFFFEFGSVRFFGAVSLWENVGLFGRFSALCTVRFRVLPPFGSVRFDSSSCFGFSARFDWGGLWLIARIRLLRVENSAHPESECLCVRMHVYVYIWVCVCSFVSVCSKWKSASTAQLKKEI